MHDGLYLRTKENSKYEKPNFNLAQLIEIALNRIAYQSSFRFEPDYNITKEILDTINSLSSGKKSQNLVSVTQADIENYFEKIGTPSLT